MGVFMKKRRFKESRGSIDILKAVLSAILSLALSTFVFSLIAYFLEDPLSAIGLFSLLSLLSSAAVHCLIAERVLSLERLAAIVGGVGCALISALAALIIGGGSVQPTVFVGYGAYIGCVLLFSSFKRRRVRR